VLNYVTGSIRNKIIAVILIAVVSAVLVSSITAALRQADRQFSAKQNEIEAIAAAMATTIAEAVATSKHRRIAATLNAIARIPDVTTAAAYAPDGALLVQHGTGIILQRDNKSAKPGQRIGPFSAFQLSTYSVETPIIHAGKPVGRLLLIADLSPLRAALSENLLMSLIYGAFAAAIGMAAALLLQRMITRPIMALTQTMQKVRDTGNFEQSADRLSRDETGLMVDTFNDMLTHIRERDEALRQHRDQLESTVATRTQDLREAVAIATKANAAKSEFLATMSHEIRTPMNGMLVMAELLSGSNLAPRLQRYADVIVKSGNGLLAIINDILDFSKIEAGKLELESIPVAPRGLVDDTLQLFSERAVSADLEIAAYVSPDVPEQIVGDPVRLGQVLTNLVNNALKFTETGGVMVRIDTVPATRQDPTTSHLRFSVRDTGIGIPDDKIATIFDAFAQADQSTTRKFGGTGIGLSICRRLIGAMNGELSVESKLGEGSTFSFIVPVTSLAEAALPKLDNGTRSAAVNLHPGLTRDALVAALGDWGFHIAHDPSTADIILSDVAELSSSVSTTNANASLIPPVIAIGQFGDTRGERLLKTGHATRLLDRPLPVTELRELLETAARDPESLSIQNTSNSASPQITNATSFAGARVLAADDSPVNREVLAEVLRRLDIEATFVEDGAAAVQAVRNAQYDLVFMDGSMPVLDGFEASRQIRDWEDDHHLDRIPIVALTAHVAGDKGAKWRESGMTDFISKPFTLGEIEACMKRWLRDTLESAPVEPVTNPPATQTDDLQTLLLDPDVLDMLRSIQSPDDNLVGRVIALYLEHAPPALASLIELNTSSDLSHLDEIADAAHALKSLSRNIGALQVGNFADRIERSARETGEHPAQADLDKLANALAQTLTALGDLDEIKAAA